MKQLLIISLLIFSIGCSYSKKKKTQIKNEVKQENSISSAELMLDSEDVLFAKRDTIDRLRN